ERPVSRSMMTCADSTLPKGSKSFSKSLSVTSNVRLPTYNFLPMRGLLERKTHIRSLGARRLRGTLASLWGRGEADAREGTTTARRGPQAPRVSASVRTVLSTVQGQTGLCPTGLGRPDLLARLAAECSPTWHGGSAWRLR